MTNVLPIRLEDASNLEGLERLDVIDLDEVHSAVQAYLDDLAVEVARSDKTLPASRSGRNHGRSWLLYSYRTFRPAPPTGIDPVVAGVTVIGAPEGSFNVHADLVGETRGDILAETQPRDVVGRAALVEACRDAALFLATKAERIQYALRDPSRAA